MNTRLRPVLLASLLSAVLAGAVLRADTTAGAPPAQKILVITGSDSMNDFVTFIHQTTAWWSCGTDYDATGFLAEVKIHNETVQTTVPSLAVLNTYDQVWDLRFSANNCQGTVAGCGADGITAAQQADYLSYIAGGGSLFLMGDNGGYPGRNTPIQAIANAVDSASAFQTSALTTNNDTQQGAYVDIAAATAAENFQTDYRDITGTRRWIAAQYNGLVTTWGNAYPILKDNLTGMGTAFAFDCGNMKPAYQAGKLEIVFDWQMMGGGGQVAYCGPPAYTGTTIGYNERFWENSIDFLVHGNACATPTFTRTATPTATRTSTRTATPTATTTNTVNPSPTYTATPSATPSSTPTATRTASPTQSVTATATPSFTPTSTRTTSPTQSVTATATPSSTPTATRTDSPTQSVTRTVTPTATPSFSPSPLASATNSPSVTPTYTATSTRTDSPTRSSTPSVTLTATPTATVTESRSPTHTPTDSPTRTPTATPSATSSITPTSTQSPLFTATSTPTYTATPSITVTATLTATRTASSTATPSATQSVTWTGSPTRTPSGTPTASVTDSPTRTVSPTITPTPIPAPFQISARVYNSAGELVKELYVGAASEEPDGLGLDKDNFVGSQDKVSLVLRGQLSGAPGGLAWDGSNNASQWVSAGVYYIKVSSTNPFGETQSYIKPVTVVPVQAETWLRMTNAAGETVWAQRLSEGVSAWSLSAESLVVEGEGQASSGPALRVSLDYSAGGSTQVDWDGRGANGQPVASGIYQLSLSSIQPGQRATVQVKTINVLRGNDADLLSGAVLGPNPVKGVDSVTLYYTPVTGLGGASVELYTLDGGRVAAAIDAAQTGSLRIPVSSLSGGVYACVVKLGGVRRVMKLAVVR